MKIKTTMRYHFTSIRVAIIKRKNKQKKSIGEDVEKSEPLGTGGGNIKWYNHCGEQYRDPSKN